MALSVAAQPTTEELLAQFARTGDAQIRTEIIDRHTGLVRSLAHKFVRPGTSAEDLEQEAWVALIRAVDRYNPSHEAKFSTYAIHCIIGQLKRYFRDRTWGFKAPRSLTDLANRLPQRQERLARELGREPTQLEMAQSFGVSEETLAEAKAVCGMYHLASLDDPVGDDTLADVSGYIDPALQMTDTRVGIQQVMARLNPRHQTVLRLRFWEGLSQKEAGRRIGVSQMHAGRLEQQALSRLRGLLTDQASASV